MFFFMAQFGLGTQTTKQPGFSRDGMYNPGLMSFPGPKKVLDVVTKMRHMVFFEG